MYNGNTSTQEQSVHEQDNDLDQGRKLLYSRITNDSVSTFNRFAAAKAADATDNNASEHHFAYAQFTYYPVPTFNRFAAAKTAHFAIDPFTQHYFAHAGPPEHPVPSEHRVTASKPSGIAKLAKFLFAKLRPRYPADREYNNHSLGDHYANVAH